MIKKYSQGLSSIIILVIVILVAVMIGGGVIILQSSRTPSSSIPAANTSSNVSSTESFVPDETRFVTPVIGFVGKFMKARLENNQPLAESFLTDNAKKQYSQPGLTLIGTSDPHFVNRDLLGCQKKSEDKYLCKVRIYEGLTADEKTTGYFDEYLTVIRNDNKYLIDSVKREEYVNIAENKPYLNTNYGFTLSSDPNQSKSYTDYPDMCSFQIIPIIKDCGDIAKNCPPAKIIPGFKGYPDEVRHPLVHTQKVTFPDNPVSFCFVKGVPEYGVGSVYDNYYYITKTNDSRCFAMHFVIHKANCEMFSAKEQIDKCKQNESKKDQIPNEYIKTFKFVTDSH